MFANKAVLKRYHKQKSRGREGFGFIEIKDGVVIGGKRAEDEKDILKALEESTADEILFHHRFPTSTPNFIESTHPIEVKHRSLKYTYYVVHNGIIQNDEEMKKEHEKEKFVYTTAIKKQWITKGNVYSEAMFNDSEALAIDFAKSIEKGTPMKSKGSIATIALQVDKKTKKAVALFYGRNTGNPLKVEQGKDLFGLSSESGKEIKVNTLYRYDYATGTITDEYKTIGLPAYSQSSYGVYGGRDEDYPAFGYWDEETGRWVDTGKPFKKNLCHGSDWPGNLDNDDDEDWIDEEEDEFIYQWDEEIDDLKTKIKDAYRAGDYDTAMELESELDTMELHFEELKRESRRERENERRNLNLLSVPKVETTGVVSDVVAGKKIGF